MFSLSVEKFIAWSPGLSLDKPSDPSGNFSFLNEPKYTLTQVNSAQGRRLSELTKTSVDLALRISQSSKIDHIVFSSRHGELANSTALLEMIAEKEVLSPTLFSQSVHNTSIGTFTLLKKTHAPTTALGGGKNSFMMGLMSSYLFLKENPSTQVLYVSADETIPEIFANHVSERNIPFATAMLLSLNPNGKKMEFSIENHSSAATDANPQALDFINWFFSESKDFKLNGETMIWNLRK